MQVNVHHKTHLWDLLCLVCPAPPPPPITITHNSQLVWSNICQLKTQVISVCPRELNAARPTLHHCTTCTAPLHHPHRTIAPPAPHYCTTAPPMHTAPLHHPHRTTAPLAPHHRTTRAAPPHHPSHPAPRPNVMMSEKPHKAQLLDLDKNKC